MGIEMERRERWNMGVSYGCRNGRDTFPASQQFSIRGQPHVTSAGAELEVNNDGTVDLR